MIRLFHVPGSRSTRVRWLLEELEVPYALETLELGGESMRRADFRAASPLGTVPALVDGERVLYESGAIVQDLLERYGGGRLAPAPGTPERSAFLGWLHWAEASLTTPLSELLRFWVFPPEARRLEAVGKSARKRLGRALEVLDTALADAPYLVDGRFSAADIMAALAPRLARDMGELPTGLEHVEKYLERLAQRPAYQRAHAS